MASPAYLRFYEETIFELAATLTPMMRSAASPR